MRFILLLSLLVLLAGCNRGSPPEGPPGLDDSPPVAYVNAAAVGKGDGSSWADAYTDLQTALQNTSSGQIWVAAGTYKPSFRTDSKNPHTATFQLKNNVAIYGGFSGNEANFSDRKPETHQTILDGQYETANSSGNIYHVVTSENTNETAVLDGFTIQNGHAILSSPPNDRGGGLYNSEGSPTLSNLVFTSNSAHKGGGMYSVRSKPTDVLQGNPRLEHVWFVCAKTSQDSCAQNYATGDGGGFYNDGGDPVLRYVSFGNDDASEAGNKADGNGGGMYSSGGNPEFHNVTFYQNTASGYGGGLYIAAGGSPDSPVIMEQVVFSNNHGTSGGGGLYNASGTIKLTSGTFVNNGVGMGSSGGGLYNQGLLNQDQDRGSVTLIGTTANHTTFQDNTAQLNGGGLYNESGSISLSGAFKFEYNKAAGDGGALYNNGTLTLDGGAQKEGSFSGNTATRNGGAIYSSGDHALQISNVSSINTNNAMTGGAIYLTLTGSATVTLSTVDFNGNTAERDGGGLYASGSGTITLQTVNFDNNSAGGNGGGMHNSGNTLTFEGPEQNSFTGNKGVLGGGLYNEKANATLTKVVFNANQGSTGGGMWTGTPDLNEPGASIPQLVLEQVNFTNNNASGLSGGLAVHGSAVRFNRGMVTGNTSLVTPGMNLDCYSLNAYSMPVVLTNLVFASNTATQNGGTLNIVSCPLQISNITVAGNRAQHYAGLSLDLALPANYAIAIANSIFWGNQDSAGLTQVAQFNVLNCPDRARPNFSVKNNIIQGGFSDPHLDCRSTINNILDDDPLFVCAGCNPVNLRPKDTSPAIDAGDPSLLPDGVTTDIDGKPRDVDGTIELGAYELQVSKLSLHFTDTHVNISENPTRKGNVRLPKPAPAGGVKVDLTLLDVDRHPTTCATFHSSSVTILQGQSKAEIPITFNCGGPGQGNAFGFFLVADGGPYGKAEIEFVVWRNPISLHFADTHVNISENPDRTGTVELPPSAPADVKVDLTLLDANRNPSTCATFHSSSVTIPQGQTSAPISITFTCGGPGQGNAFGFFLVADGGPYGKAEVEFVVWRTPLSLHFADTHVNVSENPSRTGTVELPQPAPAGGVKVNLTHLDKHRVPDNFCATFPSSSVTIPQGQTSAPISITFHCESDPRDPIISFLGADGGLYGKDEVEFHAY